MSEQYTKAQLERMVVGFQSERDALTSDKARLQMRMGELEADRDQISLTLDVAKADRDKWFNRAKVLEAALAKANALGHQNVKPDFALKTPEPAKGKPMFNYNGDLVGYEPETVVKHEPRIRHQDTECICTCGGPWPCPQADRGAAK